MFNSKKVYVLFLLCFFSFSLISGAVASDPDYRNFYGIAWRGNALDNIRYAKQMGYGYVAYQPGMENLSEASNLKFYLTDPEYYVYPAPVHSVIDISKTYSSDAILTYESHFALKSDTESFPNNIAPSWWFSDHEFRVILDFQQQSVINDTVEAIIAKAKSLENFSINYKFAGLIWDIPDLETNFVTGLDGSFVGLTYWTELDSCASSTHQHDYSTYSEGKAAYYKRLYLRIREEFPDAKFIMEPWRINNWIIEIDGRLDAMELMPDMLIQESWGTAFVDEDYPFYSSFIGIDHVGLTTPSTTYGYDYDNRLYAAKAAINGAWFSWFGRFGDTADMPNYQNIYEVPARLQLIRMLPNWDNISNVPLSDRSWDGATYISSRSYADPNIIYSRQPNTNKLFCVFLNTAGKIKLLPGEKVISVYRTNGSFIENGYGGSDVAIDEFVTGDEIRLLDEINKDKGYIVWTATDTDGDGYSSDTDCNDDNAAINPGAAESCDGIDNNCNNVIDDVPSYRDIDGDGYGNPVDSVILCDMPFGYVGNNFDCNDNNIAVNPDVVEVCDDGIDNDCDGVEALCGPSGWYGGGGQWQFRGSVSVASGMTSVDLANFPVLIKITDIEHPVFDMAQADGDDIIFVDSNGVKLAHELEKYDPSTGELVAWIRMPVISSIADTEVYMYYGNADALNQQNKEGVWDSNYVMIQHLSETSGQQHVDSTSNNNDSTSVIVEAQGTSGKIGGADELNGINNYIAIPDAASLDINGPLTVSVWIHPRSNMSDGQLGILTKGVTLGSGYSMTFDNGGDCSPYTIFMKYTTAGSVCANSDSIALNQWKHVVYTTDATSAFIYINGQLEGSNIPTPFNGGVNNLNLLIGERSPEQRFNGFIDEVRISNTARSAEWIAAEYNNQNNPGNYIQFATSEVFCTDSDNDGYAVEGGACGSVDCNDNDVDVYPGGPPVRVMGAAINYYPALQAAYDASSDGSTIEGNIVNLTEDLYFNSDKTLTLTGGYDCGYLMVTGITTISGNVVISGGKVTIENLGIQ